MTKILQFLFIGILLISAGPVCAEEAWKEHRGRHFIIYYKDAPQGFVKSVEKAAESYYREITENLGFTRYKGWTWDDRAEIYIYRDQEDYQMNSRAASWSHGAASIRERVIVTFPSAHGFFDSTLPHELGHIIFREFIGVRSPIPAWLDEGVAMYQEKAKRWGANKRVLQAIEDETFIPLDELSSMPLSSSTDSETVDLFYAEAASVVYYMITELGQFKFVSFCKKLQDGQGLERALEAAYIRFKSVDDLNRAWINYLKK